MTHEEYNYIVKELGNTIFNRKSDDSLQTVYYCRGIIDAYMDFLTRFADRNTKEDLIKVIKNARIEV